jgi:hypothetical protein
MSDGFNYLHDNDDANLEVGNYQKSVLINLFLNQRIVIDYKLILERHWINFSRVVPWNETG